MPGDERDLFHSPDSCQIRTEASVTSFGKPYRSEPYNECSERELLLYPRFDGTATKNSIHTRRAAETFGLQTQG
jgi:hypothetical protein